MDERGWCYPLRGPTLAAGRSAAPQAYPTRSRSARTPASHSRPRLLATCSPKSVAGRRSAMSRQKSGPQVSSIGMAFPLSSARKRLTGNGAGPDGQLVGPSGEPEGMAPTADPGEEMTLGVAFEVIRRNLFDAPLVHVAGRDQALHDQVPQPFGGIRLDLVVVGSHWLSWAPSTVTWMVPAPAAWIATAWFSSTACHPKAWRAHRRLARSLLRQPCFVLFLRGAGQRNSLGFVSCKSVVESLMALPTQHRQVIHVFHSQILVSPVMHIQTRGQITHLTTMPSPLKCQFPLGPPFGGIEIFEILRSVPLHASSTNSDRRSLPSTVTWR